MRRSRRHRATDVKKARGRRVCRGSHRVAAARHGGVAPFLPGSDRCAAGNRHGKVCDQAIHWLPFLCTRNFSADDTSTNTCAAGYFDLPNSQRFNHPGF